MHKPKEFRLDNMPFLIGMFQTPKNPNGLPNTLPFSYWYDEEHATLRQMPSHDVTEYLDEAYKAGSLLGTPMNNDGLGQEYLNDFFQFVENSVETLANKSALEIGCGKGYFLKKLQEHTKCAIGIEPGSASKPIWNSLNVTVVNDFFPSKNITQQFDIIASFCVMEHIADDVQFIKNMLSQLSENGKIIIAVPNCEEQLNRCDPSIFVHEHYSYHGMDHLIYFLSKCGLSVTNQSYSEYGGLLYVCAEKVGQIVPVSKPDFDIDLFAKKLGEFNNHIHTEVARILSEGKPLGIYCAARALAGLPLDGNYRFFDDDPYIHDLYYPPFDAPVESMQDLVNNPVEELWIFSYSFADVIEDKLRKFDSLNNTKIVKLVHMSQDIRKNS